MMPDYLLHDLDAALVRFYDDADQRADSSHLARDLRRLTLAIRERIARGLAERERERQYAALCDQLRDLAADRDAFPASELPDLDAEALGAAMRDLGYALRVRAHVPTWCRG